MDRMDLEATLIAAVEHLASDGFIAYPTETVWGLGACADRSLAIERLMSWKRRSAEAPLAVLVPSREASVELGCEVDARAGHLMSAFWPGPLMIIVPCRERFAPGVCRGDGALGLRCSSHPIAHGLSVALQEAGLGPLTSTSLNRAGQSAAVNLDAAEVAMSDAAGADQETPMLVSVIGQDAGGAEPSSVVDCTGIEPRILRVGAIAPEALEEVWAQ